MIGRKRETLDATWNSMEAVYGRRRVGKTFLVRHHFAGRIHFLLTGVQKASLREQLSNFTEALTKVRGDETPQASPPKTWQEALHILTKHLQTQPGHGPIPLLFDEFSWLSNSQSRFLLAFDHFWNSWAAHDARMKVVIFGSAASWMIKKVIRDKGGLHNRVTRRLPMVPFTLQESKAFLESRNVTLTLSS